MEDNKEYTVEINNFDEEVNAEGSVFLGKWVLAYTDCDGKEVYGVWWNIGKGRGVKGKVILLDNKQKINIPVLDKPSKGMQFRVVIKKKFEKERFIIANVIRVYRENPSFNSSLSLAHNCDMDSNLNSRFMEMNF